MRAPVGVERGRRDHSVQHGRGELDQRRVPQHGHPPRDAHQQHTRAHDGRPVGRRRAARLPGRRTDTQVGSGGEGERGVLILFYDYWQPILYDFF